MTLSQKLDEAIKRLTESSKVTRQLIAKLNEATTEEKEEMAEAIYTKLIQLGTGTGWVIKSYDTERQLDIAFIRTQTKYQGKYTYLSMNPNNLHLYLSFDESKYTKQDFEL